MKVRNIFRKSFELYTDFSNRIENKTFIETKNEWHHLRTRGDRKLLEEIDRVTNHQPFEYFKKYFSDPNSTFTINDARELVKFLRKRWDWIQPTVKNYTTQIYTSPSTHFCWMLAWELSVSGLVEAHPLAILMPSLSLYNAVDQIHLREIENTPENELLIQQETKNNFDNYVRSYGEPINEMKKNALLDAQLAAEAKYKLQPYQFITSEDGQHIIDVAECLQSAEETGVFKQTHALHNGMQVILTPLEKNNLINQSKEAKNYYELIVNYNQAKKSGNNAASAIYNIIVQLNNAGVHAFNGGTEDVAGVDAIRAVKYFHDFLNQLKIKQRQVIYRCKDYNGKTFEEYWLYLLLGAAQESSYDLGLSKKPLALKTDELARLQKRFFKLTGDDPLWPCVEILSSHIEDIWHIHHRKLSQIQPTSTKKSTVLNLKKEKEILATQYKVVKNALTKIPYHISEPLFIDLNQEKIFIKAAAQNVIVTEKILIEITNNINTAYHYELYNSLLTSHQLRKIIDTPHKLTQLLINTNASNVYDLIFKNLGTEHCQGLVNHFFHLKNILDTIDVKTCSAILPNLFDSKFINSLVINKKDYNCLFEDMQKEKCEIIKNKIQFRGAIRFPSQILNYSLFNFSSSKRAHYLPNDEKEKVLVKKLKL